MYVAFCGLAVVETLVGVRTIPDPYLLMATGLGIRPDVRYARPRRRRLRRDGIKSLFETTAKRLGFGDRGQRTEIESRFRRPTKPTSQLSLF